MDGNRFHREISREELDEMYYQSLRDEANSDEIKTLKAENTKLCEDVAALEHQLAREKNFNRDNSKYREWLEQYIESYAGINVEVLEKEYYDELKETEKLNREFDEVYG